MRIFTTMASIPPRQDSLHQTIESILKEQTTKVDKLILNLCEEYERFPNMSFREDSIPSLGGLVVNKTRDRGPASKILGFIEFYEKEMISEEEDIVVIHDDDYIYGENFIRSLVAPILEDRADATTHLYVDYFSEKEIRDEVIRSNHVYPCFPGYLGICFRIDKQVISRMREYFENVIERIPKAMYHDDAIITSFLRRMNYDILWINDRSSLREKSDPNAMSHPLFDEGFAEGETKKFRDEISYTILKEFP